MTDKIITASIFVALTLGSFYAVAAEPSPSVTATPPAILVQSPDGGVIGETRAATTPAPSPSSCVRQVLQKRSGRWKVIFTGIP